MVTRLNSGTSIESDHGQQEVLPVVVDGCCVVAVGSLRKNFCVGVGERGSVWEEAIVSFELVTDVSDPREDRMVLFDGDVFRSYPWKTSPGSPITSDRWSSVLGPKSSDV